MRRLSSLGAVAGAAAIFLTSVIGCGSDSGIDGGSGGAGGTGGAGGGTVSVDELFQQGPYEVGYRQMTISYDAVASTEPRELVLRVWYPAEPDSGASLARYSIGDGLVDLPAVYALDAPPVTEDGDLPFVIYSHGNGGEGLLAYPYGELMASYGWVLVAPNHTGNTALDFLGSPDPFVRVALDRPHDITAIIDEFESGLSGDELAGKADTSAVLLFGHSFGGYTTFAAGGADVDFDVLNAGCDGTPDPDCEVLADPDVEAAYRAGFGDPRIVALAPQAPALVGFADGELAALEVPTMLMSGRLDQTIPQAEGADPAWAALDHPGDLWVEMPLGAHYSFITICHDLTPELLDFFRSDAVQDGCADEFIDTRESIPVLAAYVFAFGRRYVLDETQWDSVLTGPPLGNPGDFVVTVK